MALIEIIIDDKKTEVERDRWVLDVAKEMGISIPTLCYHPAMEPYGACRLCVVEVTKGKRAWLTTSCDLPVREGLSIKTNTPAVIESRKTTIELLLTRAPNAESIQKLAKEYGVGKRRFKSKRDSDKCILCGLCVRVCEKLIGASAISFINRGFDRRVGTPFDELSDTCVGCNACMAVCPTGHITSLIKNDVRCIETWKTKLEMIRCETCGRTYIPAKQYNLIKGKLRNHIGVTEACPLCRRSQTAAQMRANRGYGHSEVRNFYGS